MAASIKTLTTTLSRTLSRMIIRLPFDVLDIIAPSCCCVCGRRMSRGEETICVSCLSRMPMTGFERNPYENEMAKTFWGRVRPFEKAFALIYHMPHSDSAHPVYQLKYMKKPDVGVGLGVVMGKVMKDAGLLDDVDALLPMPLTRKRQFRRGYNQSYMIALGLHDVTGLPVLTKAVRRTVFNGSQTQKDRLGRAENVEHAFQLVKGEELRGRHVLIIDDVVTTGATAVALAKEIKKAGDVRISVASVAFAGQQFSGYSDNDL